MGHGNSRMVETKPREMLLERPLTSLRFGFTILRFDICFETEIAKMKIFREWELIGNLREISQRRCLFYEKVCLPRPIRV